jgi:hypothetical protein
MKPPPAIARRKRAVSTAKVRRVRGYFVFN